MSLITDKVFFNALKANSSIVEDTGGRIYNTAIPVPDEQVDKEPLPYIIITFDGLNNEGYTKDNSFEGDDDNVQIGILVAAEDRENLGKLMQTIRHAVIDYFESDAHVKDDFDLIPESYVFSASNIQYDDQKPCYFQTLVYECETKP